MTLQKYLVRIAAATALALSGAAASAETYQFRFLANPDARQPSQDKSLDVLHTVTIDTDKIVSFDSETLMRTDTWLRGGIHMTMTHQGKTVSLNEGLNTASTYVSITGHDYPEGFLNLSFRGPSFFALEFAPKSPFIDGHGLPYDPFVYGFLFSYQDNQAYKDFSDLWLAGNTALLPAYKVSAVPEPSILGMAMLGLLACFAATRKASRMGTR